MEKKRRSWQTQDLIVTIKLYNYPEITTNAKHVSMLTIQHMNTSFFYFNWACWVMDISFSRIKISSTYSLATLLGISYRIDPLFVFRTLLILCSTHPTRCWKHYTEILVYICVIALHIYLFICTFMMRISCSTTSQSCSVGLRSSDIGAQTWQWTRWTDV